MRSLPGVSAAPGRVLPPSLNPHRIITPFCSPVVYH